MHGLPLCNHCLLFIDLHELLVVLLMVRLLYKHVNCEVSVPRFSPVTDSAEEHLVKFSLKLVQVAAVPRAVLSIWISTILVHLLLRRWHVYELLPVQLLKLRSLLLLHVFLFNGGGVNESYIKFHASDLYFS